MSQPYNIGYESWQMRCCGAPLKIGQVTTLYLDYRDEEDLSSGFHVDYWEEHHHGMNRKITGKVTGIKAVFIDKYNPSTSIHEINDPDNVYSAFDATYIDGRSDTGDYCCRKPLDVSYYVITLENAAITEIEDGEF